MLHRVHECVETRKANHGMIPLVCITEVFSVNRWLMRPSNCVWKVERHWGRRRYIKSRGRQRNREKEGTLSMKTSRVSTWLITSLRDTSGSEEWRDGGRSGGREGWIIHNYQEGECCYSCGKIWCKRQGKRLGNEPAIYTSTHRPISRAVECRGGRVYFRLPGFGSKSPAHFSASTMSAKIYWFKQHRAIAMKTQNEL